MKRDYLWSEPQLAMLREGFATWGRTKFREAMRSVTPPERGMPSIGQIAAKGAEMGLVAKVQRSQSRKLSAANVEPIRRRAPRRYTKPEIEQRKKPPGQPEPTPAPVAAAGASPLSRLGLAPSSVMRFEPIPGGRVDRPEVKTGEISAEEAETCLNSVLRRTEKAKRMLSTTPTGGSPDVATIVRETRLEAHIVRRLWMEVRTARRQAAE